MVLLKDKDQTLPLKDDRKIALFGCASYNTLGGGFGSGMVNTTDTVSLSQGLENAEYSVDPALQTQYEKYIT
ncbi:MAG: glycoside hydrolase family 3 C-terminal domain-containing protein, partial [Nitrosotalea sp.]